MKIGRATGRPTIWDTKINVALLLCVSVGWTCFCPSEGFGGDALYGKKKVVLDLSPHVIETGGVVSGTIILSDSSVSGSVTVKIVTSPSGSGLTDFTVQVSSGVGSFTFSCLADGLVILQAVWGQFNSNQDMAFFYSAAPPYCDCDYTSFIRAAGTVFPPPPTNTLKPQIMRIGFPAPWTGPCLPPTIPSCAAVQCEYQAVFLWIPLLNKWVEILRNETPCPPIGP